MHWWITILTWYKCCPHWVDVQWPWPKSIHQRWRSQKTFKGQSTHAYVRVVTYVCIDGFPSNLEQMLSSLRRCAVTMSSKVKVTQNLYFLFSHSWPVVVSNFGQVQRTSQVERKTKCLQKNKSRDIALDCLVYIAPNTDWHSSLILFQQA